MNAVERDLDVKLFKKHGNTFNVTEEGKRFYDRIIYHINGIDNLFQNFKSDLNSKIKIRISCHPIVGQLIIPSIINTIHNKYNCNIEFNIFELSYEEAIQLLEEDKLDIAIYPKIQKDIDLLPPYIKIIKLFKYELACFVSKYHNLDNKNEKDITLTDANRVVTIGKYYIDAKFRHLINNMVIAKIHNYQMVIPTVKLLKVMAAIDINVIKIFNDIDDNIIVKNVSHLIDKCYYNIFFLEKSKHFDIINEINSIILDLVKFGF